MNSVSLKKILPPVLKWFAVLAGAILTFVIAYYPYSVQIGNVVAVAPPGRSFLAFWIWREWISGFFIDSYIHAKPFNLYNLIYYGILSNGSLPMTGSVLDIMAISYPLRKLFSFAFPLYWNLKFVIILMINSIAGYYACRNLTKREDAGILCGIFMAVNPFLVMMLGKARLREALIGFVILAVYWLYELSKKPDRRKALYFGIFWGLSSVFYFFYGFFILWIAVLVIGGKIILELIRKRTGEIKQFCLNFGLSVLAVLIISAPWAIPYIPLMGKSNGEYKVAGVAFFKDIPSPQQVYSPTQQADPNHGDLSVVRLIMAEEMPLYFYFPVFFSILGVFAFLKPRPFVFLMLFVFLLFSILSFGPYLKFVNNPDLEGFHRGVDGKFVALPYIFFYKYVPFISRLHHPDNYLSFASVGLMMLCALGAGRLFGFISGWKFGKYVNFLIFAAVAVSLLTGMKGYHPRAKYDICRIEIPEIYFKLNTEPQCGVYELPIPGREPSLQGANDRYDFYQAFHGKKMILSRYANMNMNYFKPGGQPDLFGDEFRDLERAGNGFNDYLAHIYEDREPSYSDQDVENVKNLGYKYLILHECEFARYREQQNQNMPAEEKSFTYRAAKDHFMSSDKFELVGTGREYPENFIPVNRFLPEYEVSVFRIK